MPFRHSVPDEWSELRASLSGAVDVQAAFDTVVAGVSRVLGSPSCIVDGSARGWRIRSQARGGLPVAAVDLPHVLQAISTGDAVVSLDLRPTALGRWTSVPIDPAGSPATAVLLVGGDWPQLDRLAEWLPFAIAAAREREERDATMRLVFESYAIARKTSRPEDEDLVAQQIVDRVARSISAERVALAMYRADEDCLAVVATSGYAADQVRHARIGAGEWVMGHVFASGRPVVVSDVRQIRHVPRGRQQYRTFSFAVVPIVAGRSPLAVLSATDKQDGSPFGHRDARALRSFAAIAALALSSARNATELRRLSRAVNTDALTGLFNRPYFDARLHEEVERAKRAGSSLTLLMADIDQFKSVNDTFGHPVGDEVLQSVGQVMRSSVRVFDVCARYGGDEFAILMPTSDHESAIESAERIRRRVAECRHRDERLQRVSPVTISIGVAVLEPGDTPADVVRRADAALYRAKASGRNAVRAAVPERLPTAYFPESTWPPDRDD